MPADSFDSIDASTLMPDLIAPGGQIEPARLQLIDRLIEDSSNNALPQSNINNQGTGTGERGTQAAAARRRGPQEG